ncbi:MAG: DUF4350 domain-containing protein [bacterium]
MNSIWLVLWFLSSSWLFLTPVFVPPAPVWGAGAIALAIGLKVWATERGRRAKSFPFRSSLYDSLLLCGLILLIQAAVLPVVYFFAARYHQISFLQPLVYPLLKAAGLRVSLSDGALFVQTVDKVFKVSVTLERLGFFPFLLSLSGGLMLLFATGQGKGRMGKFLLILLGYSFFRFLVLLIISVKINNQAIFWSSLITSLSYLPFFLLLAEFMPFSQSPEQSASSLSQSHLICPAHPVRPAFSRTSFRFGSLFFLCSFFLVLAMGFCDPGIKKPGRILIDEKHSDWEWTDEKFDTSLFGRKTDYNFYCLSEYLSYFYSQVERNHQLLTRKILAETDILILKTPTREYTGSEVRAIQDFVARGGGLFLIGDHTNVFGMSTYLNKVAERFGISFRYDVTYDLPTYQLSLYRKPCLLPHPVVQHVPCFLFGSSCTLKIPLEAASVMTGYGLRNHYLDYSQKNFFPIPEEDPDYEFGLFVQAAAIPYRKGRVLAYTDSTCFSNFFIFIPGKPELLLGSIEWLNRKNRYGMINPILFLAAMGCLLSLSMGWRPARADFLGTLLTFGLFGVVLGVFTGHLLNRNSYAYPRARKDFFRIALESEHSSLFLPVSRLADASDKSFLTFFVWTQRLGYVPCLNPSLEEALRQGTSIVLIDPVKDFRPEEISGIKNYLSSGGRVFLMDSPQNRQSTSNQLLNEFDMTIDFQNKVSGGIFDEARSALGEFDQDACQVRGGKALLTDREGKAALSMKNYGDGLIAVFGASHLFRDESLGNTSMVPDEYQRLLGEMEFWIFESLARKEFVPFSLYSPAE